MPKIYLSPSFQHQNIGVEDYGTEEKRCNEIADVVERELNKNSNFIVVRNNPDMTLEEVIADSNKSNADIHFSIHTNAGPSSARGCEVYAYAKGTKGDKLAQIIYRRLSEITPSEDRGVKYNSLAETSQTKAVAVLTEVAFHSNIEDANWIINNIEEIGKELAKSLYEYFDIEYKDNEEEATEKPIDNKPNKSQINEDGKWGKETTKKAQEVFGTFVDGIVSNQYLAYKTRNPGLLSYTFEWKENPSRNGSLLIGAIQEKIGVNKDKFIGPDTIKAMQKWLGTPVDGIISYPSVMVKAFQNWLNKQ